jgi:predicted transcriptional regulator
MISSSHQFEVGDVMANYYTPFSLRVSEELLDKVKQLAAAHKRSANKEIEFALEQYVAAYEQEHGSIRLPPQA